MSPFDIAVLAMLISFIMAILPGPSGIAPPMVTDFAMFSLLHFIIAAVAGLIASAAVTKAVANRIFIARSPLNQKAALRLRGQREPLRLKTKIVSRSGEQKDELLPSAPGPEGDIRARDGVLRTRAPASTPESRMSRNQRSTLPMRQIALVLSAALCSAAVLPAR